MRSQEDQCCCCANAARGDEESVGRSEGEREAERAKTHMYILAEIVRTASPEALKRQLPLDRKACPSHHLACTTKVGVRVCHISSRHQLSFHLSSARDGVEARKHETSEACNLAIFLLLPEGY